MIKIILLLATLAASQVYENPNLHGRFTPPGGWAIDSPKLYGTSGLTIKTTRVGLQPVTITMWKYSSNDEAQSIGREDCFRLLALVFKSLSSYTSAPLATEVNDTTYASGRTFSAIHIKHIDAKTNWIRLTACYGIYGQEMEFTTSLTDFDTNSALYYAVWTGLEFYTPAVSAKISANNAESIERKSFIDALGRKQKIAGQGAPRQSNFNDALIFRR